MKTNMGTLDRAIRVIVATIIVALYIGGALEGPLGVVLILLAIIFAVTGVAGVCPLYLPFGLSTIFRKKNA
jgi:hypothetical protein